MWRMVTRGLVLGLLVLSLVSSASAQTEFIAFLERPLANETISGLVTVHGWAVDPVGISRIDLIIDGQFVHSANLSIPRTDIVDSHPDWAGSQNRAPGFQTGFAAARYSNGTHTLMVRIFTEDNESYEVGQRTIFVDNSINQAPIGYVDSPDTVGIYDVNGSFPVVGWAADSDGIARIDVQIDSLSTQTAVYGSPRPDVNNTFPDSPSTLFSGFLAQIDSSRLLDGVHALTVRATDRNGLSRTIGRRTIQVFNSENNLRPFGSLDQPQRDGVLFGTCGRSGPVVSPPFDPGRRITPVRGWALDLGTREDTGRVAYAELLVDGVRWYSSDDCAFSASFNAYINCYGLPRPDVSKYYPTHPDSPRSGYFFGLDIGSLIDLHGLPEGRHILKVRVGDLEQTFADLPSTSGVPVFFSCIRSNSFFPQGFIDYPHNFAYVKGTVQFHGWAMPLVSTVEISIDGTVAGLAEYGFLRTDVVAAYPTESNSALRSGWRFNMDTTQLGDGRHRLTVTAISTNGGQRAEIGSVDFYVDNQNQ